MPLTVTQTFPLTIAQNDPNTTVIDGYFEFEELHVHAGHTLELRPGAELVRLDVPPANPSHGDGGIVVHGHLKAVRLPGQAPILIRSQNPTGHRGHLMIHGTAELDNIEVRDFGRTKIAVLSPTNPIGRYAVHFHLVGDLGYQSRVDNCLIHDTIQPSVYRHGIAIHGTHGLTVRGNTVRNKGGTGIFTEDGTESNNLIENNTIEDIRNQYGLASSTTVPPRPVERAVHLNDFGWEGVGIWLRGMQNRVKNNTVRRCGIGFEIFAQESPTQYQPLNEISGNTVEDCYDGFQPWYLGTNGSNTAPIYCPVRQYIDTFTIRRCKRGVFSYYLGRVTMRDFNISNCNTGWVGADYRLHECEMVRPVITSCGVGIGVSSFTSGGLLIAEGAFNNPISINMGTLWHTGDGRVLPPRAVTIRDCTFIGATHIKRAVSTDGFLNLIQSDKCRVEGYQQVSGDNFDLYFSEQSPTTILPPTTNGGRTVGSPVAGLTNEQNLAQHGVCWAGELVPTGVITRLGIVGKVKTI